MIEIDVKVKKWGNSLGVVLPKETVAQMKLKENDTIKIMVPPKNDTMEELWGILGPLTSTEQKRMTRDFMKMRNENRRLERKKTERLSSLTRTRRQS